MATLLSELERCAALLSTPVRFEYSTLEIANATIFDQISAGEFPVCLILAFDIQDVGREGVRVKSEAEVNAIFLDSVPASTIDKPIQEIENEIVAPMRALTRELVNKLDLSDIVEEDGISALTNRSVHEAILDAHLYGNWGVFTIKFTETTKCCDD